MNKKMKKYIIVFIALLVIPLVVVFGRFLFLEIREHYFELKGFYFSSNILDIDNPKYEVDNWSGNTAYTFKIDIANMKNATEHTKSNIEYKMEMECPDNVTCSSDFAFESDQLEGTSSIKKYWTISVSPNGQIEGIVEIKIKASSLTPYKKTISATIKLSVGGVDYEIVDEEGNYYAILRLENNLDTNVTLNLNFDPRKVNIDMVNSLVMNNPSLSYTTIDSKSYVNDLMIELGSNSEEYIFFYKEDIEKNYTYPFSSTDSIITITK